MNAEPALFDCRNILPRKCILPVVADLAVRFPEWVESNYLDVLSSDNTLAPKLCVLFGRGLVPVVTL